MPGLEVVVPEPLAIAVAQPPCVPYDVAVNAVTQAAAIRAAGARVVVFSELSLTGYHLDAPAITVEDPRLAPLVEACADTGALALVGAPVGDETGREYIAMLAVDGSGTTVAYRKMWLSPTEAERFAPGEGPVVCEVDGWRLGLAICKDTNTPRHAADTAALGIDAYVAGTVTTSKDAARQTERARAIAVEHRVWVAVASFAGSSGEGYDDTAGRSGIWAPDAAVAVQAGAETGAIARATLG
ncbi:MAG: Nitrilase/cyanide hydratase and apolipoprotein N-acyltransferase [Streptosporangiaceae bacterium]|jgi:predicted amidohydrolase|nr:Nitrilase/cyanide hydratase and apolipoprotein N-acyltransferase [Streptosporangiaceae bacterium]